MLSASRLEDKQAVMKPNNNLSHLPRHFVMTCMTAQLRPELHVTGEQGVANQTASQF